MAFDKKQVAIAVRVLNGMPEGELLLGYLFEFCHVYSNSFSPDSNVTAFNEGQRSVGIELISLLVNEPDRFKAETARKVSAQAEGKTS